MMSPCDASSTPKPSSEPPPWSHKTNAVLSPGYVINPHLMKSVSVAGAAMSSSPRSESSVRLPWFTLKRLVFVQLGMFSTGSEL